jgi:cytochrome P450
MINGDHWKSQRKVANPAFHRAMPVKLFARLTLEMFDVIEASGNPVINISDFMERWTLDAIGNAGFGKFLNKSWAILTPCIGFNFNAVAEKDNSWVSMYDIIQKALQEPFYFLLPAFDTKYRWMFPKRQEAHQQLDRFTEMLEQIIVKKREAIENGTNQNESLEENEKDLLTLMIEAEANGEGIMSNKELKVRTQRFLAKSDFFFQDNLAIFFLAGHDTTSSTLSSVFYYLAVNPVSHFFF